MLIVCNPPGKCIKSENNTGVIGAAYQILTNTNTSKGTCDLLGLQNILTSWTTPEVCLLELQAPLNRWNGPCSTKPMGQLAYNFHTEMAYCALKLTSHANFTCVFSANTGSWGYPSNTWIVIYSNGSDTMKTDIGVQELKTCEYTAIFNTVWGCPTDCIKDKTMCSGKGYATLIEQLTFTAFTAFQRRLWLWHGK